MAVNLLRREPDVQQRDNHVGDVLQGGAVDEGHRVVEAVKRDDGAAGIRRLHLHGIGAAGVAPGNLVQTGVLGQLQNHVKFLIVIVINQHFHISEEFELFDDFAVVAREELRMGSSDIR